MAWDLKLDPASRDLTSGLVTSLEEILQRLVTRLQREYGEWFLDITAGLPWYQNGEGLLGSRNKTMLDLIIRRETLNTTGVQRILVMNTLFFHRAYTIYMQLLLAHDEVVNFTMTEAGFQWHMA